MWIPDSNQEQMPRGKKKKKLDWWRLTGRMNDWKEAWKQVEIEKMANRTQGKKELSVEEVTWEKN